ncbi:sal-like protein 3 [Periophthalmus magnuspinnatus]|uniref:sal-like protein 3 n=1 Tax=Periophthalmus magnuspinnatus TaxID=409849 RepID=UPI00145B60BF|nr:sal-like protein 3 [Periophthalmus magnuspinnatus]
MVPGKNSAMSRRKQAKPQHLRSEEEATVQGELLFGHDSAEGLCRDDTSAVDPSNDDTHICDKCCAEFFTWIELSEHQKVCTADNPLVLIVKDSEDSQTGPSPVPSILSSDSSPPGSPDYEIGGDILGNDNESSDNLDEARDQDEGMQIDTLQDKFTYNYTSSSSQNSESNLPLKSITTGYGMPSTNVTLEILHSTRVAVAQFSQSLNNHPGAKGAPAAAIPVILEHLLNLQQQQVHQLHLIEQICSQVAYMNRQPTQAALNPVSRALPLGPNPFPTPPSGVPPSILPLSGTMPSTVNGQAVVTLPSKLEKIQTLQTFTRDSSENSSSSSTSVSTLLPPYTSSISSTLSSSTPLSLGPNNLLSQSSNLPFLPHSPPSSSVIFPNPLASIAATASTLDPLAALMKQRKSKPPNVSLFDTKPSPEEPFFKHKCRFCAKVFGSDSALQIHLRSHTGERPFKCNICGNRFSTKGNLKVHFQRHKDKYPHVQMNPYPVPEYLDNVPTSSGIPYGMSIPPEKPVSSWMESKPVVAALPASLGLPIASAVSGLGSSNDPISVTPSLKSPSAGECISLSPNHTSNEARFSPLSEPSQEIEAPNLLKTNGVQLMHNFTSKPNFESSTVSTPEASTSPVPTSPPSHTEDTKLSAMLESMQPSETSKLQKLVENIDKKITDPNECVLCHRVLSCQSALKMHYRIHTGERPYKCKVCGRAFTTKGNLKTHIGVHRENPPVQVQHSCPICQKKFTNAVVLQQHIRMHMVGQISDSNNMESPQEMDSEISLSDKNFDSLSSNSNDVTDDISMDEEEEENLEESFSSSPRSSFSSLAALENQMKSIDNAYKLLTNGFSDNSKSLEKSPKSPDQTNLDGVTRIRSPPVLGKSRTGSQEDLGPSLKTELSQSLTNTAETIGPEQKETQSTKLSVKEETPYCMSFHFSPAVGQSTPSLVPTSTPLGLLKPALNGQPTISNELHPPAPFSVHVPPAYPSSGSPGPLSLLGTAPPRRTAKQHNCNACGKNFSSASALQIHERTHTGEKPFVCSVCGRAFTTKGNLKVHMGTHMWNNAPARRGRRLSVENPLALLGGDTLKFGDMFQKDVGSRSVDPGFWSRYASAITNSLKNNEISVIQNRALPQIHPLSVERGSTPISLTKSMEQGNNRHFSMLIDDTKEIGIN